MSDKEKVILVLKESIRFGEESGFIYDNMKEKYKHISKIDNLNAIIQRKIKSIESLDERAYSFREIYNIAKMACNKLQNHKTYNNNSAELILKVIDLQHF